MEGPSWGWFVLPVASGVLLRSWNLPAQVLSDDEMHLVRAALETGLGDILVTFSRLDNSIPLTALFRLLLDLGGRPDELLFRAPAWVAGVCLLVAAPLWAAGWVGRRAAFAFAWLLAVSPYLVFFARIARSYAPATLAAFGAVAAFASWWRRPRWPAAAAYVACAALAAWLHLGAATFVVAPFLFAAGELARRRRPGGAREVVALAAVTGAAFLAFLLPARASLAALVAEKHQPLAVTAGEVAQVAGLLAGSRFALATLALSLAAVGGALLLRRRDPLLAGLSVAVVGGHLVGLLALSPLAHEHALVLSRYLLVALPWVLLWVAVAVGSLAASGRAGAVLAGVAVAGLVVAGPFLDPAFGRSSFAHHNLYLSFVTPRPALPPASAAVYRWVAAEVTGPGDLVEVPFRAVWRLNTVFALGQEIHGRPVRVAAPHGPVVESSLVFRRLLASRPAALLASGARVVVLHRDLAAEERALPELATYPQPQVPWQPFAILAPRAHAARERELRRAWGPPHYRGPAAVAWDLERVRRGERRRGAAAPR